MGILSWIVVGGIAGWLASKIMDADASMGIGANIIVGIIGGLIGGFLSSSLLDIDMSGFNITSILIAVVGSVILIAILRAVRR